jgi:hypothetical protein
MVWSRVETRQYIATLRPIIHLIDCADYTVIVSNRRGFVESKSLFIGDKMEFYEELTMTGYLTFTPSL